MQLREKLEGEKLWRYGEGLLFVGFFLLAFLLCGRISYSDGDDAYFYEMAHSMPLWEYLKMRYVGWEGRMTSEAMTYVAFYFGKGFWQPVNALILTLLPVGLIHMIKKMTGGLSPRKSFWLAMTVYLGILSLGIQVIGYGAFWITGSTFYLWSIVAGLWAAMPYVYLTFDGKNGCHTALADASARKDEGSGKGAFLYGLPCAFLAAMGQEQIAAVVIVFGALAMLYHLYKERKVPWLHVLEELVMIAALVVLLISPGTEARSQSEIVQWMPQFATMSLGNHIFITVQWMLSSFANQGKMLFFLIWVVGIWVLWTREHGIRRGKSRLLMMVGGVFSVVSLLPYLGVDFFSEMGMGVIDQTQRVENVATPAALTGQNWMALAWWLGAVVFTMVLLWQIGEELRDKALMVLMVLAACASELLMFFSPTMYASGDRVLFVAQILLWLILGRLVSKLDRDWPPAMLVGVGGVLNAIHGLPEIFMYL